MKFTFCLSGEERGGKRKAGIWGGESPDLQGAQRLKVGETPDGAPCVRQGQWPLSGALRGVPVEGGVPKPGTG